MKGGTLLFTVVPHKDRAFYHHLEVGPFPSNFVLSSFLGQFMRAGEELGRSEELLDLFESKFVNLTREIFQVQDNGVNPLWLYDSPDVIDLCIILFF